jgi:autotransporter translocation and assembly factor TamB
MLIALFVVALAIVLFLCLLLGFRYGLKLGMNAAKGIVPEIKNPIIAVKDAVEDIKAHDEQVEADKLFREGFTNIFSYDPNKK